MKGRVEANEEELEAWGDAILAVPALEAVFGKLDLSLKEQRFTTGSRKLYENNVCWALSGVTIFGFKGRIDIAPFFIPLMNKSGYD